MYIYPFLHYTFVHYTFVHYTFVHYTFVHFTFVHYTFVHYTVDRVYILDLNICKCVHLSICTFIQYNVPEKHFHIQTFSQMYICTIVH